FAVIETPLMTAPVFIYTSEPWAALSFGRPIFRPSVHTGANEGGSFAPVLFLFPLHRRSRRILALDPVPRAAGDIGRAKPLRHDAFQAKLARAWHTASPSMMQEREGGLVSP